MSLLQNAHHHHSPLADKFNGLSLRAANVPSGHNGQMQQMMMATTIPAPSSPTAKRIARVEAEKRVKEKRNAFKSGGKSRSLGNAAGDAIFSTTTTSLASPVPPPPRAHHPSLATRSESVNRHHRHHLHPGGANMASHQLRKSSESIYGSGKKNQIVPIDGAGGISAHSQHIIQFCLDNARGDLSARVLSRMVHKRPDFALFCANLGMDNWTLLADQFRQYLADVVGNLASAEKIRHFSTLFGAAQVNWRSFGFKADFFSEMASALTTECVFLDGAAHTPTDAFEAWAELVEMMFSAVRDGYYSHVRQLRRSNFSLGYSQSMMGGKVRQSSVRATAGHSSLEI